jgi:hypothetical protein
MNIYIFIWHSTFVTPSVSLPESFAPSAEINLFPECYALIGPFA